MILRTVRSVTVAGETGMVQTRKFAMEPAVREFLMCCLRARLDPRARAAAHAMALRGLDWEAVWRSAEAERLAPLLHGVLRHEAFVPPHVAKRLASVYRFVGFRNLALLQELGVVIRQLAAHGIAAIVLKGAALADTVYRNISLRPMGDVDLLLHRPDIRSALQILATLGYDPARAETHPGAVETYENEVLVRKAAGLGTLLELHWSLFDSPYYQDKLDLTWWWDTAVSIQIASAPAKMLGPEAQVVHLCGHLALHHGGHGLLWLHDIAEVVAAYGTTIDWPAVLSRARAYDLVLPLQQGLCRVSEEWGAPIPPTVLEQLCILQPSRGESRIYTWLSAPNRSVAQRFWADVSSFSGWRARLRFARASLFPSAAYMQQRYRVPHRLLVPLFYPYRWLRGLLSAF